MALKGLDIFKLSPKTNCKDCGCPTCMAFCMKVAQGALPIETCPHMSQEAKTAVQAASEPPMRTVEAGGCRLGGETVLFRHEKTFVSPTQYAVSVHDNEETLRRAAEIDYERIGEREQVSYLLVHTEENTEAFAESAKKAAATGKTVILDTQNVEAAEAAVKAIGETKPILNGANRENWEAMNRLAAEAGLVLGVTGSSLEERFAVLSALEAAGNRNLLIDATGSTVKETFANAVQLRRSALADGVRTFGYPSIVNVGVLAKGDRHLQTALAALFTVKYGSVVVMEDMTMAQALPLFGLRQNIFADPQKPMKVEPGIYPINGAAPDDPCMLTVDFALTYFLVAGEIERSKVPVNLLITDASGMSVLTAWAAGKLSADSIKNFFTQYHIAEKIRSRTLIIPGKVAVMREDIRAVLPDWNVLTGTREAAEIVKYLRDGEHLKVSKTNEAKNAEKPKTAGIPEIKVVDLGVHYQPRNPDSRKFVVIGERIHCISPTIREAMQTMNPGPILQRAAEQISAGATYLDVNIGPASTNGPELMTWAVKLLQQNFDNVPLALDTANKKAIEAGIAVYNRANGKPIINSADAGSRISYIDLAAANDAIVIALCSADGIARDNEERLHHCHTMLDRGMKLGMEPEDLWFDPLFLVIKGMQDKQMEVLEAIRLFSEEGLRSTGGLSNSSNGAPKAIRPILDASMMAMCMMQGMTSAIVNPCAPRMMETVRCCDVIRNRELYSDTFLDTNNDN